MSEVLQDTPDEAVKPTVKLLGHELTKRPFTNKELDEWARIQDERGVEAALKRMVALQAEARTLSDKRVELQARAVEKLEAKLDAEYERDDWDVDKIARLTERIIEENEKLAELQAADGSRIAEAAFEIGNRIDETQAVTQEAHLEMCHYLAGKPEAFQAWLERATLEDYQAAREVVQAGLVPFGNRRTRRARSGKGTP